MNIKHLKKIIINMKTFIIKSDLSDQEKRDLASETIADNNKGLPVDFILQSDDGKTFKLILDSNNDLKIIEI